MPEQHSFAYWLTHGLTEKWKQKTDAAIARDKKLVQYQASYRELIRRYK